MLMAPQGAMDTSADAGVQAGAAAAAAEEEEEVLPGPNGTTLGAPPVL